MEARQALREIYGPALGKARATHLLKALKQLHAQGLLDGEPPKAKMLSRYVIAPKPQR
jgi:hypothetical protein